MKPTARLVWTGAALGLGLLGVTLGGLFAGEARQRPELASRFVRADAETAARAACASRAPFVVLDTFAHFKPANIDHELFDASAGERSRVQHGDVVAAIVEASHPGAVAYQTDPVFNVRTLADDFRRLVDDIERGRLARPAAVVSSIVLPVDLGEINARLAKDRAFADGEISERRADLLRVVTDGFSPANPYAEIDRQLGRLREAGVPVFVAAGNTGPDRMLNMLALSEGVFAVGALGRDGTPASYTSQPDLVSVWSPGYVVLTEAPGGLSVSGGRGVELKGAGLAEQSAIIAAFSGERAEGLVQETSVSLKRFGAAIPARMRYRYLARALKPGLYRTTDLMEAYGYAPSLGTYARAEAEGPYMHFPSDTIFRADADGRLRFDPIGDGSPGQLQVADATSFAAPNLCAAELFPRSAAAAPGL